MNNALRPSAASGQTSIWTCLSVWLAACIGYVFLTTGALPFNADAGYYLSMARDIFAGKRIINDLNSGMTPFFFYLLQPVYAIFGDTYPVMTRTVMLLQVINGILLYNIATHYARTRGLALFITCTYVLTAFSLDGIWIIMEPVMMTPILLAFLIHTRFGVSWVTGAAIGFLIGTSMMCKQYGLMFLAHFSVLGLIARTTWQTRFTYWIMLGLFTTVPFFLFVIIKDVSVIETLIQFRFLGSLGAKYLGTESHFFTRTMFMTIAFGLIWLTFPLLWLFARGVTERKSPFNENILVMAVFSLIILYIRQFNHYFQIALPWFMLLWIDIIERIEDDALQGGLFRMTAAVTVSALSLLFIYAPPTVNALTAKGLTLIYLALAGAVLLLPALSKRYPTALASCALIALLLPATAVLRIDNAALAAEKQMQDDVITAVHAHFPAGTKVYVDNIPWLYPAAKLVNPWGDYVFEPIIEDLDWSVIDNVALSSKHTVLLEELTTRGYARIGHYNDEIVFYSNGQGER